MFQLLIPLQIQQQMTIVLAEGFVSGKQAIVMDIAVNNDLPTASTVGDVMASFDKAREAIHNVFVGTTHRLSSIMEPIMGSKP